MAVGLRQRGVPARVVGGYLGADRVPFSRDLLVRASRAHLWVEVHFPGEGWVAFDPTPEAGLQPAVTGWPGLLSMWDRTVMAWDSWVIGLDMADQVDLLFAVREVAVVAFGIARRSALWLALAATLAVVAWIVRRRLPARTAAAPTMPRFYRRMLALAARRGIRPATTETAGEFAARAAETLGDRQAVGLLSRLYERERFGGTPPSQTETAALTAALHRLGA
jgi:hypothetical protein